MIAASAAIVVVDALIAWIYIMVTGGGSLSVTLSNILFLEGGVTLIIGALVEFFQIGGRESKMVVSTKVLFPVKGKSADQAPESPIEVKSPGWMLIFLGGLLIVYSVTLVLVFAR